MEKTNTHSYERNRDPILKILKEIITSDNQRLLEVGTGSGQHSIYFAPHFKHLAWITSDILQKHNAITDLLRKSTIKNIHGPVEFEVGKDPFPKQRFDLSFTANTFHIMHWKIGKTLIKLWGNHLREGAQVIIYGPFNYNGEFTSESNKTFDQKLKAQDSKMGIRSFEDIKKVMIKNGFSFTKDYEMPANNRMLLFTKLGNSI